MTKKILRMLYVMIVCFIVIVCLGVFCGCSGENLEEYKKTKAEELQTYSDAKGERNYSADDRQAICDAVVAGKAAIADATTKTEVDMAFNHAKLTIDTVGMDETILGNFYTLQEAYDEGMLTVEDLQVIAEYLEKNVSAPEEINPGILKKIKEVAARNLREKEPNRFPDAKAEDFTITKYYGTYNGCVAFKIENIYFSHFAVCVDEAIAGVEFHYPTPVKIIVWSVL